MRTVNKVILVGNVTKEPFVKTTMGGKKVALFTVATNRSYKDGMGQQQTEAEYTICSAWGILADRCEQYLAKGKLVYVEGHLKTRSIDREDGTRLFKTEVVVGNLIFLSKKEYEEGGYASEYDHDDSAFDEPVFDDKIQ
ncbi:MAG TPA: single-stranded DNA-binding protein [bacterium]|nr:single-stranded DNA-binding protein [bacterium]